MDRAITRIEAALSRIEQATPNRPAGDDEPSSGDNALRRRVSAVLADLDALIGSLEQ